MNLQEIKNNYNRGRMKIEDIQWMIDTVELQQKELIKTNERELSYIYDIEQLDVMIDLLQVEVKQYQLHETILLERLKNQTLEIKEMKKDRRLIRFWELAEENLKLAQELSELKGGEMIGTQSR